MPEQARLHLRIAGEVVVEAVGKRVAQGLQPLRSRSKRGARFVLTHVEARAQIAVERGFAFHFGKAPDSPDVVALYPREIVFSLCIEESEYGVGIRRCIDMGNSEIVAHDGHAFGDGLQTRHLCGCRVLRGGRGSGRGR